MAIVLSENLGAKLHLVYVEDIPVPYAWPESTIYDPDFREELDRS